MHRHFMGRFLLHGSYTPYTNLVRSCAAVTRSAPSDAARLMRPSNCAARRAAAAASLRKVEGENAASGALGGAAATGADAFAVRRSATA